MRSTMRLRHEDLPKDIGFVFFIRFGMNQILNALRREGLHAAWFGGTLHEQDLNVDESAILTA